MASNLLVTGKWGEVHVTSAQQRNFNSGVVGDGQYVMNGLTATMSDSNTLHVNPGVACMNGADVEVPAGGVDVTVTNGTQGMLRNDLICVRYTMEGSTQKEKAELVCVRGTPAASDPQDPEYNDGSILDGSLVVDMPLYRISLNGISVGEPEPLFDVLMPMADLRDSVSQTQLYSDDNWLVMRFGPFMYARCHHVATAGSDSWESTKCPFSIPEGLRPTTETIAPVCTENGGSTTGAIKADASGGLMVQNMGSTTSADVRSGVLVWIPGK